MLRLSIYIIGWIAAVPVAWAIDVPGVVIDYSPAPSQVYIGSPSLVILPDGRYVASHDFFGPGSTRSRTAVFGSSDHGTTWQKLAQIDGQWWSTLLVHRNALYIMGTSREHGYCVIRRSSDGGRTWTEPKDEDSGLLLGDAKYHCAPVPVVEHDGRIWRAMEDAMGPGGWGAHFQMFMMSAQADADLLRASSWTSSNRLAGDPAWLNGQFGGWLEGNAVVAPDGQVVNILRVHNPPAGGKAAIIPISKDGTQARFDPETGFIDLPGGSKKFTIRYDPISKKYWTLSNPVLPKHVDPRPDRVRNAVGLMSSPDLRTWRLHGILLYHPDPDRHGFQYLDWQFEGDDIVAVSRTAYDDDHGGAHNQHDANYLTFHRIGGFRAGQTKPVGSGVPSAMP